MIQKQWRLCAWCAVFHLFDIIGVRFDPSAFTRGPLTINIHFTDINEDHVLGVGASTVHHRANVVDPGAVVSVRLDRATLMEAVSDHTALDAAGIEGDRSVVVDLFASLATFDAAALIEPQTRSASV